MSTVKWMLSFWISLASVTKALPSFPVSTQFVFIKSPAGRFGSYDSLFYSLVSYRNFGHRKTVRNLPKFLVSSISTWDPKEHELLERGVTMPERVGTGTRYPFRHFVCLFVCHFCFFQSPVKYLLVGCVNLRPRTWCCYEPGWEKPNKWGKAVPDL